MLEGMGQRMTEAAERMRNADSETLWSMIQNLAMGAGQWNEEDPFTITNNVIAATVLRVAEMEHWTVQHTALALAYVHIVMSNDHQKDLMEMMNYMQRPMVIHQHCEGCTCKDKITRWENEG
jgi:hypothetical protein